jgi:hypothetical protein
MHGELLDARCPEDNVTHQIAVGESAREFQVIFHPIDCCDAIWYEGLKSQRDH